MMETKGNNLTTEDLTTQKIGINAAEKSLQKQWDHLQAMKSKLPETSKAHKTVAEKLQDNMDGEATTADVSKKMPKRVNQNTAEHQEQAQSHPSESPQSWTAVTPQT